MNTLNEVELLNKNYDLEVGKALNVGGDILKKNMGGFIGFFAIQVVLALVFNKLSSGKFNSFSVNDILSFMLAIVSLAINGMMAPGNYYVAHKIRSKQETTFGDFFYGFSNNPFQFILLHIVFCALIFVATLFFILPGIFLAVSYMFCTCIQVVYKCGFWESLELSRKVVTKVWGKAFLLILAFIGLNILGAVFCGLGLLYTMPLSSCAIYAAFHEIFKPGNSVMEDKIASFGQGEKDINTERDENK